MDAHARSLLERLNTSASPKHSRLSTPEKATTSGAAEATSDESEGQESEESPISSPVRSTFFAVVSEPGTSASIRDLLASALRSRELSVETNHAPGPLQSGGDDSKINPSHPEHKPTPPLSEAATRLTLLTSDGETSANHEDLPATPSESHKSSVPSTATDTIPEQQGPVSSLTGLYIVNDVPSIVTLPPLSSRPGPRSAADAEQFTYMGVCVEAIAKISRIFSPSDQEIISATKGYIVYALRNGRIRIVDQNSGTRGIAETPSSAPVVSVSIRDGSNSHEYLLVLDKSHDITIWDINQWQVDSSDVPLDYLVRFQTAGTKPDESFTPIAKWCPRYHNCLAVCTGLAIHIYNFSDQVLSRSGQIIGRQTVDISEGKGHAISITVETGVRDFAFSADGSALAVLDYHGDVLFWALFQSLEVQDFFLNSIHEDKVHFSDPSLKYSLPRDLNPCSIQFLELGDEKEAAPFTPVVLVGSNYNRRLRLINIGEGRLLQEIVLPSNADENTPLQNFPIYFTREKQILTVGDTLSQLIYFFHLQSPPLVTLAECQSDYIISIGKPKYNATTEFPEGILPAFDYVTELPFFPDCRLQTLATTPSEEEDLDVFTAHNHGFTMLLLNKGSILPDSYKAAKRAPSKTMPNPQLGKVKTASKFQLSSPTLSSLSRRSSAESLRSDRYTRPQLSRRQSAEMLMKKGSPPPKPHPTSTSPEPEKTPVSESSEDVPPPAVVIEKQEAPEPIKEEAPAAEKEIGALGQEVEAIFKQALDEQYERLATDQKRLMTTADDRHESILRVVSSTLTTNVGKLLEQTVRQSIEKSVLPTVTATVKKAVDQQLAKALAGPLDKALTKEMRSSVLEGIQKAILDNDNGTKLADTITKDLGAMIEKSVQKELSSTFSTSLEKSVGPLLSKMEERLQSSFEKSMQRLQKESRASQQDLTKKLQSLADSVSKLAVQIQPSHPKVSNESMTADESTSDIERQREQIEQYFKNGNFPAGIETWSDLPDTQQAALFEICAEYDPSILNKVDQLSLMSAASVISTTFKTDAEGRLTWLEKIVSLAKREGRYTEYWPRVFQLLDQRLDAAYEEFSAKNHKSPLARKMAVVQYYIQNKMKEIKG